MMPLSFLMDVGLADQVAPRGNKPWEDISLKIRVFFLLNGIELADHGLMPSRWGHLWFPMGPLSAATCRNFVEARRTSALRLDRGRGYPWQHAAASLKLFDRDIDYPHR